MTYDPDQRLAEPGEDDSRTERIEIGFAIPVWLTHEHQRLLHQLVNSICEYGPNVPADGVHWPSGYGSKPKWSRADARFLGKEAGVLDADAPESGEPTFDDAVLFLETSARGFVSDKERERKVTRLESMATAAEELERCWRELDGENDPDGTKRDQLFVAAALYAKEKFGSQKLATVQQKKD